MWGNFHHSEAYQSMWATLLAQSVPEHASPTFFQYVTDAIFRTLIVTECAIARQDGPLHEASLSYSEKNALRYAAGYVIRHLCKMLHRSAHPKKAEFLLYLQDMNDVEISTDESEDWVRIVDRGGIRHIDDMLYMVFELEVRRHLQFGRASQGPQREAIKNEVGQSEDVLFHWCTVSAEWEVETDQALLELIIDLWITICGFSGTSGWLEKYKQRQKKTVQKSKGVCKNLLSNSQIHATLARFTPRQFPRTGPRQKEFTTRRA